MNDNNLHVTLPGHLSPLGDNEWALWRWVGLRSAGFPIERLYQIAQPDCAAAADLYLHAERKRQQIQHALMQDLRAQLKACEGEQRRQLGKAIRQFEQGQLSVAISDIVDTSAFEEADAAVVRARNTFERAFADAIVQSLHALHEIGHDATFREAILWQNRQAVHTGVDVLLAKPPALEARTSKLRQKEALLTSYVQRYCSKNDTIGFFGPVGWARMSDQDLFLSVQPGTHLLAQRSVYFEGWCIDALAEKIASNETLHPWFVPRRMPSVHIEGTTVYLPLTPPTTIPQAHAAVLQRCDGERTARQIAHELISMNVPGLLREEDVYDVLSMLRSRRRIVWTLEVPVEGLYPEQQLRRQLQRIEDDALRTQALSVLASLEVEKEAVTRAAGNVEQLDYALDALEKTFTQLTGSEVTRHAGQLYAGRALVYEDCRRDVTIDIGPHLAATLGPPLSLLLTSARWFTSEAAALYREAFNEIYDEVAADTPSGERIQFSSFWLYAHHLLFDEHLPLLARLEDELQQRWVSILDIPLYEERRCMYHADDLRQQVQEVFAASHPGWESARYHSPDIMIAAASVDDMQKGRYQYVLGEIHPGANTLQSAFFVAHHPSGYELYQAIQRDSSPTRIILVPSKELGGTTTRMSNAFILPTDWRFVFAHDSCNVSSHRAIPLGALTIHTAGESLMVQTRDGRLQWDIVDILGEFMMLQTLHHFTLLPKAEHTPRINFDRLVVCRETWRFPVRELVFAACEQEAERFLQVRRWVRAHDLPRRVFVKTPGEKKPFYVDFVSLASVDVFVRAIRRVTPGDDNVALITVTEMMPDLDEIWLTDDQHQHYTSEFRFVAVDTRIILGKERLYSK